TRYFIQYSLAFTEEMEVGALVWLTMLGAAAGLRQGAHLSITFLVARFAPRGRRAARALALLLGVALFLNLVAFALWQIRDERLLGITSEALGIPQWWYTAGLVLGGAAVLIRLLQAAGRLRAGGEAEWM
ncbi:MAG: TRAP transporter small permease subunit, partial [candidate division NC10 bacterium]|nr:TRAP transporter small permease subunit [candidate division NC10 bacterium]